MRWRSGRLGPIFKPFVYAAAMNTALTDGPTVWTPASLLDDEQTTFLFDNQVYEPKNYHEEYKGEVSAEYALAHSLNNATIKLAEAVGYQECRAAGEGGRNQIGAGDSGDGPRRL